MDHFHTALLKLLPPHAFHYAAMILNLIEDGAPWPNTRLHAKGTLLGKDPLAPYDPLAYRILMLLPILQQQDYDSLNHGSTAGHYLTCSQAPRMYQQKMDGSALH